MVYTLNIIIFRISWHALSYLLKIPPIRQARALLTKHAYCGCVYYRGRLNIIINEYDEKRRKNGSIDVATAQFILWFESYQIALRYLRSNWTEIKTVVWMIAKRRRMSFGRAKCSDWPVTTQLLVDRHLFVGFTLNQTNFSVSFLNQLEQQLLKWSRAKKIFHFPILVSFN